MDLVSQAGQASSSARTAPPEWPGRERGRRPGRRQCPVLTGTRTAVRCRRRPPGPSRTGSPRDRPLEPQLKELRLGPEPDSLRESGGQPLAVPGPGPGQLNLPVDPAARCPLAERAEWPSPAVHTDVYAADQQAYYVEVETGAALCTALECSNDLIGMDARFPVRRPDQGWPVKAQSRRTPSL